MVQSRAATGDSDAESTRVIDSIVKIIHAEEKITSALARARYLWYQLERKPSWKSARKTRQTVSMRTQRRAHRMYTLVNALVKQVISRTTSGFVEDGTA